MSVNAALVRFVYPTPMLGRGFGHNALVVGTAFTLGPTIASGILSVGTWPWLFAINIPFGADRDLDRLEDPAADAARSARVRFSRAPRWPRAASASSSSASAARRIRPHRPGRDRACRSHAARLAYDPPACGSSGADVADRPVQAVRMFALSAATAVCSFAVQGLAFVSLPFYFEDVLQRSASGDRLLHDSLAAGCRDHGADRGPAVRPLSGRHSRRPRPGAARHRTWCCWRRFHAAPGIANIVWRIVICGIGFGFFQTPNLRGPDVERAAASQRERQQHRRDRPPDRTNHSAQRSRRCALPSPVTTVPRWHWRSGPDLPRSAA